MNSLEHVITLQYLILYFELPVVRGIPSKAIDVVSKPISSILFSMAGHNLRQHRGTVAEMG